MSNLLLLLLLLLSAGLQVSIFRVLVDSLQGLQYGLSSGEDTVRQQERVEEVYAQEPQVRQAVQKAVNGRMANLRERN